MCDLTGVFVLAGLGMVCMLAMLIAGLVSLVFGLVVAVWVMGAVLGIGVIWLGYCYWEAQR